MPSHDFTATTAHVNYNPHADALFGAHLRAIRRRADRLFASLLLFQWLAAIAVASIISPRMWSGLEIQVHPHVWMAVFLGGVIVGLPVVLVMTKPGRPVNRFIIAVAQALIGMLLIYLTGGRSETHFHVFVSLAILAFYRDWRVLIALTVVVTADHILQGHLWPRSVYGVTMVGPWRWIEHVAWVVVEDVFLIWGCLRGISEMRAIADRQARLEVTQARIEQEVKIRTAELQESEALQAAILESALDAIVTMDHKGLIVEFNPAAEAIFGYRRKDAVGKLMADLIIPPALRKKCHDGITRFLKTGKSAIIGSLVELPAIRADGSEFPAEVSIKQILRKGTPLFTAFLRDVTDRKKIERKLRYQARHDALTDLPNRVDFQDKVEQLLVAKEGDPKASAALLLVDLDRFKEINDAFGHHYGDIVLRRISPRLRDAVKDIGTVARLGGDEFGVLLPGADATKAAEVAETILANLRPPILVDGHALEIGGSVGIALCPEHARDPIALLQCADVAMYTAKRARVGYLAYAQDQASYTPQRLEMIGELRRGIETDQLLLHYQPKIDLRTMQPTGAEALVRWLHPRDGLLAPGKFIPLAEHTGLIRPLGLWALNTALLQSRIWHRSGLDQNVAVNLAADSLADAHLVETIAGLISSSDAQPGWLTIEITESAMLADPTRARETLSQLRDLGVRVSIDDFGTGYSSLAYLKDLPVDEIKIDRSFVKDLTLGDRDGCIVRTIIDLGRDLGLQVVAEGVEDQATLDCLTALGSDFAQGFLFSDPLPPHRYAEWLCERTRELVEV